MYLFENISKTQIDYMTDIKLKIDLMFAPNSDR